MANITNYIRCFKKEEEIRKQYLNQVMEGVLPWMENERDPQARKLLLGLTPDQFITESFDYLYRLVHSAKLSAREREENCKKLKPLLNQLTKLFKKWVQEMNKSAKFIGYSNYLEYFLTLSVIPAQEFKLFLKNINDFVLLVDKDIPAMEQVRRIKDWSPVNIPAPAAVFTIQNKFNIPNEVINLISKYDPRMKKYIDRIHIEFGRDDTSSSIRYIADKDIVTLRLDKDYPLLFKALMFVHQLGNALDILGCADNKIIPFNLPKYIQDYSAIEFTHSFIKREISERDQEFIRYNLLHILADILFEIDIYTNDNQDFDKVYARAINRCYPNAKQTRNPLYVFEKRFIFSPLSALIHSMANVELYLKDANTAHSSRTV